jgi:hypothetical protein
MSVNRIYEFERVRHSSLASEVEESLRKHLQDQHFSPNSSNYYVDEIKSALGSIDHVAYDNSKKATVADMVNDLMKRTGLSQYLDELKTSISENETLKTAEATDETFPSVTIKETIDTDGPDGPNPPQTSTQEFSFANVPEMQEAIKKYIENSGAFQIAPVLNILKQVKTKLIESENEANNYMTKIPESLKNIELHNDATLLKLIKDHFAKRLNYNLSNINMVDDITSADSDKGSASSEEATDSWMTGSHGF